MQYRFIPLGLALAVAFSGCDKAPSSIADAPQQPANAPVTEPAPAPAQVFSTLERNVVGLPSDPGVSTVNQDALVSTGTAGMLVFGPYVAFAPGSYTVTFQGNVDDLTANGEVKFDAVSGKGAISHGAAATSQKGTLPALNFSLSEQVSDLEIRVYVGEGAKVTLKSYTVSPAAAN